MPANRPRGVTPIISAAEATTSAVLVLKGQYDNLALQINGTSANSARTLTFEKTYDGTNYVPMLMVNTSTADATLAVGTTAKNEAWETSVNDVYAIRVAITAITGGSITVTATMSQDR